jgi:Prokaryotic phospholipase A2
MATAGVAELTVAGPTAGRNRRWRRMLARLAAALVTACLAAGLGTFTRPVAAPAGRAAPAAYATEDARISGRSLAELLAGTGPAHRPQVLTWPAFRRMMGYTPTVARLAGSGTVRSVKPTGSCSSLLGATPFDFGLACKAHDLGYDLLRFASRSHRPAGPAARQLLDAQFERDLHAQCLATQHGPARTACDVLAAAYAGGAKLNSWRQRYGAP